MIDSKELRTDSVLVPFLLKNGKWCFVEKNTFLRVFDAEFAEVRVYNDGLAAVRLGRHWGFIDRTGVMVISPRYDWVDHFRNGIATVRIKDKSFVIDKLGNGVKAPKTSFAYADYSPEDESFLPEFVYDLYDVVERSPTGPHAVQRDGKWGFINDLGVVVIPLIYENCDGFVDGLTNATLHGKAGFIDTAGNTVIPFVYDEVSPFIYFNDTFYARQNGKWGKVHRDGSILIPFKYDWYEGMDTFDEDLDAFELDGSWIYVDNLGNEYRQL